MSFFTKNLVHKSNFNYSNKCRFIRIIRFIRVKLDYKKIKKIWLQKDQELIHLKFKSDEDWNKFLNMFRYVPFNYSSHRLNYLYEYFSVNSEVTNFQYDILWIGCKNK